MNNIKTARLMRGMQQQELADKIGVSKAYMSDMETRKRSAGPKLLPMLAEALDVDPAYLRDEAQILGVYNFDTREMDACKIMCQEEIAGYGILYTVEHPEIGPLSVIVSEGIQITLSDWQAGRVIDSVEEIGEIDPQDGYWWMDARGHECIMIGDLPRVMW